MVQTIVLYYLCQIKVSLAINNNIKESSSLTDLDPCHPFHLYPPSKLLSSTIEGWGYHLLQVIDLPNPTRTLELGQLLPTHQCIEVILVARLNLNNDGFYIFISISQHYFSFHYPTYTTWLNPPPHSVLRSYGNVIYATGPMTTVLICANKTYT